MPAMMTIVPAKKKPDGVSEEAWKQIVRGGPKSVPGITALQAIKSSKGAYQIKAEPTQVKVGVNLSIDDLPNEKLKLIVLSSGKRIDKKMITRAALIQLAKRCVEEIVVVIDGDEEVEGDEE